MLTVTKQYKSGRTKKVHTIELFSSAKEFPITRRQVLQNWLLHDSGIGSDMESIDRRLATLSLYSSEGKTNEVFNETMNLRFTFFSMLQGIDYKTRSFACFVATINGKEYNDLTSEGLKKTAEAIAALNITDSEMDVWFEDVKKKLIRNSE